MTTNQASARASWRVAAFHVAWTFPTVWILVGAAMAIFP